MISLSHEYCHADKQVEIQGEAKITTIAYEQIHKILYISATKGDTARSLLQTVLIINRLQTYRLTDYKLKTFAVPSLRNVGKVCCVIVVRLSFCNIVCSTARLCESNIWRSWLDCSNKMKSYVTKAMPISKT